MSGGASGVSFSYVRGLTGGSGVFLGATSNTFSGSAHHQFTRYWTGSVNGGYALNNSLAARRRVATDAIQQLVRRREPRPARRPARAIQFQLWRDEAEQSRDRARWPAAAEPGFNKLSGCP